MNHRQVRCHKQAQNDWKTHQNSQRHSDGIITASSRICRSTLNKFTCKYSWKSISYFQENYLNRYEYLKTTCYLFGARMHRYIVRQLLCVNFAYRCAPMNLILTCVTLFTKLSYVRKNRKFVRKYTHGLICRTTEKIASSFTSKGLSVANVRLCFNITFFIENARLNKSNRAK